MPIHEFGHFIVARMCKVHVQRFSIGMGPVFYKKLDKHGTEFALSAIPLGGYVSMITNKLIELEPEISNQLTEEQLKNTFDSKPKWQRASIMFAGPLANFLLSIFIFTGILFKQFIRNPRRAATAPSAWKILLGGPHGLPWGWPTGGMVFFPYFL